MDLAQMKAAVTMEGVLSGTAALELIAEVERLISLCAEYRGEVDPLKDRITALECEVEESRALCDGYRGEMEHLKRDNEKLAGGCVIAQRTYALSLDDITALTLEVERLQSALTRARAEAFEDAAKVFERRIAELRAANPDNHPDEEEEKWISGTAAAIRATKGDSDEG